MRKSIETKIAQIGTFPIDEVWTPITPAINTTTFIARELSALSPIESTSLAGPINSVYGGLYYGGVDTPTTRQLAIKLALMEGAKHTVLTSSGQSAIHLVLANFARPGDHLLICDNITYSSKWLFEFYCATNNIHLEYFAPGDAQSLGTKLREQTKIVFWESPGAFTFELVDGRAIVDHCRNREVITVQDNTWSSSVFHHPLRHGVSISLLSLTKSHSAVTGHSLGALLVKQDGLFHSLKNTSALLGGSVCSDACAGALVSISTLSARLDRQMKSTIAVIAALRGHPRIKQIFHPTVSQADMAVFGRDFTGFNSLVSVETTLSDTELLEQVSKFSVIRAGYGWGGTVSLVSAFDATGWETGRRKKISGACFRLFLGLEGTDDLVDDVVRALDP